MKAWNSFYGSNWHNQWWIEMFLHVLYLLSYSIVKPEFAKTVYVRFLEKLLCHQFLALEVIRLLLLSWWNEKTFSYLHRRSNYTFYLFCMCWLDPCTIDNINTVFTCAFLHFFTHFQNWVTNNLHWELFLPANDLCPHATLLRLWCPTI